MNILNQYEIEMVAGGLREGQTIALEDGYTYQCVKGQLTRVSSVRDLDSSEMLVLDAELPEARIQDDRLSRSYG